MGDATTPTHASPMRREVPVMLAFAVFVGIGIATVLVPALSDDAHDEERNAGTQGAQTTAGASTGAGAAAAPATPPALPPDALPRAPQPAPPTQPVGP
jgi:hypothetical protein